MVNTTTPTNQITYSVHWSPIDDNVLMPEYVEDFDSLEKARQFSKTKKSEQPCLIYIVDSNDREYGWSEEFSWLF